MTAFVPPATTEAVALAIVSYIVDSLWQGVLVVLLAAAAIRVFRGANATTRYAVWYIALVAVIALPALTVGALELAHRTAAPAVAADPAPSRAAVRERAASQRPSSARVTPVEAARPRIARPRITLPSAVTLIVAVLWIAGALLGLVRIALGYVALAKLQRDALPLPPAYRDGMPLWEESTHRGGRETRLCVSSQVPVPVAVGLFDGMILMPDHLLARFDRADVDRFSLHEMAHLQRRDDWTCAFERIACAVLFFNPAVRWIARQLDLEREVACDDWVVTQTREVRPYAVGLTKMAEATPWPHRPVPTPAIFASRKSISIRIERLLNKHRDVRPTIASGPAAACAVAILVLAVVLLPVAPVIGNVIAPAAPAVAAHRTVVAHHTSAAARAVTERHAARTVAHISAPVVAPTAPAKQRVVAVATPPNVSVVVAPVKHVPRRRVSSATRAASSSPAATSVALSTTAPLAYSYSISPPASASPASSATAPHAVVAHVDLLDALNASGYSKLTADEIIALHDNGVGGKLLVAASKYFERRPTVTEIITLARAGVSSASLEDFGRRGVRASPADVVAFLYGGVSPSYAADIQHAVPGISAASIVQLAQRGVSARLVSGLRERGYDAGVPALIEFAARGVSLSYVDAMNARRNPKFTLDELVKLHDRGVTADAL